MILLDLKELKNKFIGLYGQGENIKTFFSPSRVNIIGEHIDYNGGKVLPGAIGLGTYGIVRKREDNKVFLASENVDLRVEVNIDNLKFEKEHGWGNYPKGVLYFIREVGYKIGGMDILVKGNIPYGAGLSSSASLELLIGEMVNILFNHGSIPTVELVKICQRAENEFVGVKCGIMDQFAIGMGKKEKVILLDTNNLQYEYIDMDLGDHILVIMNTNKQRELSDSKYNERREECEKGLDLIREYKDIEKLCDLSIEEFKELEEFIIPNDIKNRVEHVVYENHRVNEAVTALKQGDILKIGQLLIESHSSLRDLYEVTGKELDSIVSSANKFPDCLGARMVGAGFGGCAIAIVKKDSLDEFIDYVSKRYKENTGQDGEFYVTNISDGVREI